MSDQPTHHHHDDDCRRSAAISAISQNLTLYAHLIDKHQWDQLHRVFLPTMYLSMPEPHFEDIHSLEQFQTALREYATWNMQHAVMTPMVDFNDTFQAAHAETHFIGTIFDEHSPQDARPEEIEYGSYITDHVRTEGGWKMNRMTLRIFGRSFPVRIPQELSDTA